MNRHKRCVILGGGFGGAYCAQKLEKKLRGTDTEIIVINRTNYFVFHPLLIEAGTGNIQPRHAVVPVRAFLKNARFIMAEVIDIDTGNQEVICRIAGENEEIRIPYDQLVVAIGSITRMPDIPGLHEYGFEMKNLSDAVFLRDRTVGILEIANTIEDRGKKRSLLHFVIVGGNYTGVELAGELHEFIRNASTVYTNVEIPDCNVTIIEISDRILPTLDHDLSEYAADNLLKRGISLKLNTRSTEITGSRLILDSGEFLETRTVVWCAGIAPNPLIQHLPFPVDDNGYVLCERDLRVKGFENIWGIGDAAVNLDQDGNPYPATAQHAVRQAYHLAHNLSLVMKNKQPVPCNLRKIGSLVGLGCKTGVAKIFGVKLSGWPAWFIWRTVYLLKMPQLTRKIGVAIDWTITLFSSRDYVQLGIVHVNHPQKPNTSSSHQEN